MERKPRLRIKAYLPPELHEALQALSRATGQSKAAIIRNSVRKEIDEAAAAPRKRR